MKSRNEFENNFEWLYYLQNNLGNNDLEIQCSWIKEKDIIWSKRKKVLEVLYSQNPYDIKFVDNATHRTILDIEIVLDIDEPEPFKTIKDKAIHIISLLNKYNSIKYYIYFTGSKSYHIHIFDLNFKLYKGNKDILKSYFINKLKCDGLKIGRNMIAIEGQPHYKSGKIKKEVVL